MSVAKYGVKEVANVAFYDLTATGASKLSPVLYLDTLKVSNVENAADSTSAQGGRGNPKLLNWEYNRTGTVTLQDALMSFPMFAMLAGNEVSTTGFVNRALVGTAETSGYSYNGSQILLGVTPVTVKDGAKVYVLKGGSSFFGSYATASGVALKLNGTGAALTSSLIVGANDELHFSENVSNIMSVTIGSDKFPGTYKIVGESVIRNEATGADEPFIFVIPKAKVQGNFTITMQAEGDPSVFDMTLEALADDSGDMMHFVKATSLS